MIISILSAGCFLLGGAAFWQYRENKKLVASYRRMLDFHFAYCELLNALGQQDRMKEISNRIYGKQTTTP